MASSVFGWVRPHIPEASDGILTSAGICEGFAGAGVSSSVLLFAGFAGLVAGTLAMGAVEYSKLRAEHNRQAAQLAAERVLLETAPDAETALTMLRVAATERKPIAAKAKKVAERIPSAADRQSPVNSLRLRSAISATPIVASAIAAASASVGGLLSTMTPKSAICAASVLV